MSGFFALRIKKNVLIAKPLLFDDVAYLEVDYSILLMLIVKMYSPDGVNFYLCRSNG